MSELSGASWVSRFPTSRSLDDLTPSFRSAVNAFIGAINNAGGTVRISATYRPPERAYLMHYAWDVANGTISPSGVPSMAGVDIQWNHGDDAKSKNAAAAMVRGYEIVFRPSLTSNHSGRTAIDMTISGMIKKTIQKKNGDEVTIKKISDLNAVGASYGVNKLASDPPHWSESGR
jgi:hypothetical protein